MSGGGPGLTVATWNVCLGAEFESLLGAGPERSLHQAAGILLESVRQTRFPERAEVIARTVAEHRPDVLALQELGRWETGEGDDSRVLYSFPDIMQEALNRAGAPYVQVTCIDTVTGELPVDSRTWARFTSCDALLVRKDADVDLSVLDVDEGHYVNTHVVELAGGGKRFPIRRGWSSVDLERAGRRVRVVVTHLDSLDADVRRQQAHELVSMVAQSRHPVVVLGDLNSPASAIPGPSRLTSSSTDGVLEVLAGAGYADAWLLCRDRATLDRHEDALAGGGSVGGIASDASGSGGAAVMDWSGGGTFGRAPGLLARTDGGEQDARELTERLDYVFFDPLALEAQTVEVVGAAPDDVTRTRPALVASDHACVVAHLRFRDCGA